METCVKLTLRLSVLSESLSRSVFISSHMTRREVREAVKYKRLSLRHSPPHSLSAPRLPIYHSHSGFLPSSLLPPPSTLPLSLIPPFGFPAWLSTSPTHMKRKVEFGDPAPARNTAKENSPLIVLIDTQDSASVLSLFQAEKLAKRRDLKLVRVEDPAVKRDSKQVYKLITGKQYFEEEIRGKKSNKNSPTSKDEKVMTLGGNISTHDLRSKLQNVKKWLDKGHQIKVTIMSRKATKEAMESVYTIVEEEVTRVKGRLLQRHEKMNDIRFYIAPPKVEKIKKEETRCETSTEEAHQVLKILETAHS